MPPICGHRDHLQRRCELLQGHDFFEAGSAQHQYTDTPESLRARGGAAASDKRVTELSELEVARELIDYLHADIERLHASRDQVNETARRFAAERDSLEGAVADLKAEQNRQSEEVRRQARQISFLEGENNRLRERKLGGVETPDLLRELLRRATGENE